MLFIIFDFKRANETVEKPFVWKNLTKISHNRLKNRQNVVWNIKNKAFSMLLSHFSKTFFKRDFFDSFNGERYYLSGAQRRRILGGDTVAGDAFGAGASGLADRRYGMCFPYQKRKPVVLPRTCDGGRCLAARRIP